MRDNTQYFHINWIDGMKINKNLFIAQDDAIRNDLHDIASINLSNIKYGVLPPVVAGQNTFNVNISIDGQNTLRVSVLACQAITSGGVPINISAALRTGLNDPDGVPSVSHQFSQPSGETAFWVVLIVNPFERLPAGSIIVNESPPRFPYVLPRYTVQVVSDIQYPQFANHPLALIMGKVLVKGSGFKVDENYIPPSLSVNAHPKLLEVFSSLEVFLNKFEANCSKIIQKIFQRKQKNELSEMVLFLCDRTLLQLGQLINNFRWTLMYESPAYMLSTISALARVIKNTIDLYTDSGKDVLINYFTEWCDPKQGEIENTLLNMANERYDNNDINKSIEVVIAFVNFTSELFQTLSNLEFIGKRKEGYVVDEKIIEVADVQKPKTSSRFITR
jgi:hypothetical protein